MRAISLLALLSAGLLLAGCGSTASQITVNDPWARAAVMTGMQTQGQGTTSMAQDTAVTPMASGMAAEMASMGGTSAVYMTIVNGGREADRLIAASTDVAGTVELHESKLVDNIMQMAPVPGGIEIPPGGQAELKPGGLHVMLIGLTRDLKDGDTVRLTLTFERAGVLSVDAPVRTP